MNKKILVSLSVIGAAAAIAVGGTIAYFSDTETSTGNTFTAGELDLQLVDVQGSEDVLVSGPLFTLLDMKPGDQGEKTLGLWVDDNPACGFVNINVTSDLDNTCNEPEAADEGVGCPQGGTEGELNDEVQFVVWSDPNCNNVYEPQYEEGILTEGTLTGSKTYAIGELPTVEKQCYGIAYCFGAWDGMTCDGSQLGNESQSDSFAADLVVTAKQKRNQFDEGAGYPNGCPVGDWLAQ